VEESNVLQTLKEGQKTTRYRRKKNGVGTPSNVFGEKLTRPPLNPGRDTKEHK